MDKDIAPWHLQNLEQWKIYVVDTPFVADEKTTIIAEFTLSGTEYDVLSTLRDNDFLMKNIQDGQFAKLYRQRFELEQIK